MGEKSKRAIGIVRQSKARDDSQSPAQQADRIRLECERRGLVLVDLVEELDVSGGTPLLKRHGLRGAIETIEAGNAEVIVGAYFDRLVRSLKVQAELVERVEAAGGQVLALDTGEVSNGTPGQWLSAGVLGLMAEYHRRTTADRAGSAQIAAVARGVLPFPNVPPGYIKADRDGDGVVKGQLYPDPVRAPVVAEAVRMRADGATVVAVRSYLAEHGIKRSYHGTLALLSSRLLLGEIHFGKLVNLDAHEPIVKREIWDAAQKVKTSRGRRAKSDALLARLGVLRCGTCGARMVVGSANRAQYRIYRCPPTGDCPRRVTISADVAETFIAEAVKARGADVEGHSSMMQKWRDLEHHRDETEALYQQSLERLTQAGMLGEPGAMAGLEALKRERDSAADAAENAPEGDHEEVIRLALDWDRLSLAAQRDVIRAMVDRVVVAPGRGADRLSIDFLVA